MVTLSETRRKQVRNRQLLLLYPVNRSLIPTPFRSLVDTVCMFNRSSVDFASFYCFALHVLGSVPMRKSSAIDWTGPNGACFLPRVPIKCLNLIQISPKCHTSSEVNNLVEGHVTKIWNPWRLCTYIKFYILDIIHYHDSYFVLYFQDFTSLPS
jgi:hypothetical protein